MQRPTRRRLCDVFLINLVEFCSEAARGLTLPTLYLYCRYLDADIPFLAAMYAVFSAGRLLSSLLFGAVAQRGYYRAGYVASLAMSVVANILFMLAFAVVFDVEREGRGDSGAPVQQVRARRAAAQMSGRLVLLVARGLVGLGSGNRSICRADLARRSSLLTRMRHFTVLQATVYVAYAVTPGLALVLPYSGLGDNVQLGQTGIWLNRLTVPGFVLALCNLLTMLLVLGCYSDDDVDVDVSVSVSVATPLSDAGHSGKPRGGTTFAAAPAAPAVSSSERRRTVAALSPRVRWQGAALFAVTNFLEKGILAWAEVMIPVLYLRWEYKDMATISTGIARYSDRGAAMYLLYLGLGGLLCLLLLAPAKHLTLDFYLCAVAMAIKGVGCAITAVSISNPTLPMLIAADVCIWSIGNTIAGSTIMSGFSKLQASGRQGIAFGIIGAFGSAGRIAIPGIKALGAAAHVAPWIDVTLLSCLAFLAAAAVALFTSYAFYSPRGAGGAGGGGVSAGGGGGVIDIVVGTVARRRRLQGPTLRGGGGEDAEVDVLQLHHQPQHHHHRGEEGERTTTRRKNDGGGVGGYYSL